MGLGQYEQGMIKAIAENDIRAARQYAVLALDNDTTQKNKMFVNRYKNILTSEGANMISLPDNLKGLLLCEDVSLSFKEKRYYITDELQSIAENIFKMSKVSQQLMEMQLPYRNATLLYGQPGTGKTLFGKYIAYKLGLPFCYMNFSRIIDSYMGVTSKNIGNAFTYASSNPCIFMLDEIDTISGNRSNHAYGCDAELNRVTVTLMQEFDKLANDVVVIAATNRVDIIDAALKSRIPQKYEVSPFGREDNYKMVQKFLSDIHFAVPEEKIETILEKHSDQRTIINELTIEIAGQLMERNSREICTE